RLTILLSIVLSSLQRSTLFPYPTLFRSEIRDPQTAETAVHAANSGHLVLATVHASSAAGAIQSMRSLGVHSHFLSTSLRGILAQDRKSTRLELQSLRHLVCRLLLENKKT